ncbi:2-succinyl-5-enolpyruvyl-6-hydroxy-3-cyclohexene-1-carboxylic-acid synthase [Aquimarina agarilytica]|uniref:2-succinyl-5-enolpyruvyl-6-hydroxy-3- cyclohexene-1-carboxylic-acid synthase n=1 Tax=Aquimarina agarilytica TaxID=1087449 RepID=UPI00028884E4|nr:2-succinyl-5-enolpyruvyl-6-hydroxy-3-cyclohexene-1-carboxylic-acid synthase [Aquimarina agarilytica]
MSKKIISSIPLAQQIITISKHKNLKHIVISPGSRNAPLTISFSNDPYFKCYSIVDERCAAFFALGIAQQTNEPVALVCTSGSALLNYYPAIAEAFYSDIPLVILSADRPKEHIDIGDGQTIRQEGVFKNHILCEANLTNDIGYSDNLLHTNFSKIAKAIDIAKNEQGPTHINIPFYEPLYNTIEVAVEDVVALKSTNDVNETYTCNEEIQFEWNTTSKKLVLVGVLPPNRINDVVLDRLLKDPGVLLFTETTSNLHHAKAIPSIDQLIAKLTAKEFKQLQPELLLTFGGFVVSKKIKAFLREYTPKTHWHVNTKKAYDTYGCLTSHIKTTPQLFLDSLLGNDHPISVSNYQNFWLTQYQQGVKGHDAYLKSIPYSDLLVFDQLIKKLPKQAHLQLSNSSTIRYTQLFKLPKGVEVFCNRGTSGIDGSTSTAIGAAIMNNKSPILITGDLSFFYDSNALWNNYIPADFKIIVINNDGGGIFRILPGDKEASYFSTFLETTHQLKADKLAAMYGFTYSFTNGEDFAVKIDTFFKGNGRQILEIHTPRLINDTVLLKYFSKIRE